MRHQLSVQNLVLQAKSRQHWILALLFHGAVFLLGTLAVKMGHRPDPVSWIRIRPESVVLPIRISSGRGTTDPGSSNVARRVQRTSAKPKSLQTSHAPSQQKSATAPNLSLGPLGHLGLSVRSGTTRQKTVEAVGSKGSPPSSASAAPTESELGQPEEDLDGYGGVTPSDSNGPPRRLSAQDGFGVARQIGLKEESLAFLFFEELTKRIDRTLKFPNDFIRARRSGVVQADFEVLPNGQATGKFRVHRAEDPALRALVLVTLLEALKHPFGPELNKHLLPVDLIPNKGAIWVGASFEFVVHLDGLTRDIVLDRKSRFKNQLSFYRSGNADSKLIEFYRKTPGLILLPGVALLDVVQLVHWIGSLGKPDPKKLRDYRIDVTREEWERVIKRSGGTTQ